MQVQLQAARHPYAGSLSLRGSTSVCMSLLCTDPLRIKVKKLMAMLDAEGRSNITTVPLGKGDFQHMC